MRLRFSGTNAIVLAAALAVAAIPASVAAQGRDRDVRVEQFRMEGLGGPQIGVSIRDMEAADVTREKLSGPSGAYVDDVRAGSPAEEAGLRTGDVVMSFDGERVRSAAQLARLVRETPEGRTVDVTVQRSGSAVSLRVTPQAGRQPMVSNFTMPDIAARIIRPGGDGPFVIGPLFSGATPRLGVRVQEVGGQLAEYFGTQSGVLVTNVDDDSPANAAGIRAGDVLTKVNDEAVSNAAQLRARLAAVGGVVSVTVMRDRSEQTVTVTLPEIRAPQRAPARRLTTTGL